MNHEKDISTEQPAAKQEARLPVPDAHQERPEGSGSSTAQRPAAPGRLSQGKPGRGGRLRRSRDFQAVYRQGRRARGRWMVVFVRCREDRCRENRFGITASRKVGGAVRRSRCKRRLRELYRLYGGMGNGGMDMVVNAVQGLDRAPWAELVEDYLRCLSTLASQLGSPLESSGSTNGGSRRRSRRPAGTSQPARNTPPGRSRSTGSSVVAGWASRESCGVIPSIRGAMILSPERT